MQNDLLLMPLRLTELESLIENSVKKAFTNLDGVTSGLKSSSDEILTVDQCASFLGLSKPTIYGLISKRAIPFMKRSKRCYFSKTDLIAYLNEGKINTLKDYKPNTDSLISKK